MCDILKKNRNTVICLTVLLSFPPVGAQAGAPFVIPFELGKAGNVSIAVYDRTSGQQLRTIVAGKNYAAGAHRVEWDGLDNSGKPVSDGEYEWRLLCVPGFTVDYRMTLGTNTPDADWAFWPGNHGGISGVAVDETGIYLGASSSEVAPTFVKLSPDYRKRLWEHHHYEAWTGAGQMLVDGDRLFILQSNARLRIVEAATGKPLKAIDVAWEELGDGRKERKGAGIGLSFAAGKGAVVVAYPDQDRMRWYDTESGELTATTEITDPKAVAILEKTVYVASSTELLGLASEDGKPRVLAEDLVNPQALAVDSWRKELLLAEGEPSHQVKRFDLQGKLLSVYGEKGGRRVEGRYNQAESFLDLAGLAALPEGGFIATEPTNAPRRTALFRRTGKLITEWYGGQMYFQSAEPDGRDPHDVWFDSHWGTLVRARVDYQNGSWRPVGTYQYAGKAAGMIGVHNRLPGYASQSWRPVYHGSDRYLVQEGQLTLLRHDEREDRLIPVAVARTNITHYWDAQPDVVHEFLDNNKRSKYKAYLWVDGDGDGEPQEEEVRFSEWSAWGLHWSLDDDFAFLITNSREGEVYRLPVKEWNQAGAPVYASLDEMQLVTRVHAPLRDGMQSLNQAWRDDEGDIYCVQTSSKDKHGDKWPSHNYGDSRLLKFTPEGEVRWAVGRKAVTTPAPPNQLHTPLRIIGGVRDCVVLAERTVNPATVYTKDGLYVGRFLDNHTDDNLPAQVYKWWRDQETKVESPINYDMLRGGSLAVLNNGEVYWMAAGWNMNPTYRVTGWDGWMRKTGAVAVTGPIGHARGEGVGLAAQYYAYDLPAEASGTAGNDQNSRALPARETLFAGAATVRRIDPRVWFKWDGKRNSEKLPEGIAPDAFGVVWTGNVEPPFSEPFVFSTYTRGPVRLWVDDTRIIDDWTTYAGQQPYAYTRKEFYKKNAGAPINLSAGKPVKIRLEYFQSAPLQGEPERNIPQAHLNWESPSLSREHIPTEYLYPPNR